MTKKQSGCFLEHGVDTCEPPNMPSHRCRIHRWGF